MKNSNIVLQTDFGLEDGSVGVLKGVIANISPRTNIIDLTHSVSPYDIKEAAFLLDVYCRYFPEKTIFVTVVDPGVGTKRKGILMEVGNYYFIGPDNGIFSYVLIAKCATPNFVKKVISLENEKYFLTPVSSSFHGRDIFTPVAAHLAKGVRPEEFGSELDLGDIVKIKFPLEHKYDLEAGHRMICEVLYVDGFGNIITSLSKPNFEWFLNEAMNVKVAPNSFHFNEKRFQIQVGKETIKKISNTFKDSKKKQPIALFGGDFKDYLEIAIDEDNAAERLGVKKGDEVVVTVPRKLT